MENKKEYEQNSCNKNFQLPSPQVHFHQPTPRNNFLHRGLNISIDQQKNEAANCLPRPYHQQVQNLHVQLRQQHSPQHLKDQQSQQYNDRRQLDFNPRQLLLKVTEPPPLSVSSTSTVQSPQIWLPHEKPLPSNQQTRGKSEVPKDTNTVNQQSKHGEKESCEKKKQHGITSPLKHPTAKRVPHAPVTKQGWLHKQGSDGLMLWKKRWFVLSEYCLFYYKGPEEEKLLGSILLPSYKVTVCGPEDKINRKYAFKCEHVNMRTYILAADSHELMMVWVHVLNLASLLQAHDDANQLSDSPRLSSPNVSMEISDSRSVKEAQSQFSHSPGLHTHSSSNTTEMSGPSQQEICHYKQPLYANAPPKPRRLNDTCYPSPSPDIVDRTPNRDVRPSCVHAMQRLTLEYADDTRRTSVSPYLIQQQYETPQYQCSHTSIVQNQTSVERRTPDTYGRSNLGMMRMPQPTDYEDVYTDYSYYKAPLGPVSYFQIRKATPSVALSSPNPVCSNVSMPGSKSTSPYPVSDPIKSVNMIARPHSADFLEYELNRQQHFNYKQHPRPKSSLDINRNVNEDDKYFYSEECYAEKMRKSVQYLHTMPKYTSKQGTKTPGHPSPARHMDYENIVLDRLNSQSPICNDKTFNDLHRCLKPTKSRSDISMSKESELDASVRLEENMNRGATSIQSQYNQNKDQKYLRDQYDKVTKFVSARLAQSEFHMENMYEHRPCGADSNRKREESMKRLLEWKQRMLQSPLNRKIQDSRVCVIRDHKHSHNKTASKFSTRQRPVARRSSNLQRSSYSSDDEENEDRSKQSVHQQAGRTLDTFPPAFESLTPAQSSSVTVHSASQESVKALTSSFVISQSNIAASKLCFPEDKHGRPDSLSCMFCGPSIAKGGCVAPHTCSGHSEYSDDLKSKIAPPDIRANGALIESILSEFEEKSDANKTCKNITGQHSRQSSIKDDPTASEENYIPMTPNKSILDVSCENSSTINDSDYVGENPYVEMSQSIDLSLLAETSSNAAEQAYEILCFKESKMEPIYMELKNPEKLGINFKENPKLCDILMSQNNQINFRNNKSDSSDADDEASKELHSLDAPMHPRFSLSDTFRPASYYIGTNSEVQELQDSSYSDLVSPPSIPMSHSPSDELDATDHCLTSIQEIDSAERSTISPSYNYSIHSDNNSSYTLCRGSIHSLSGRQTDHETVSLTSQIDICGKYSSQSFENNNDTRDAPSETISNNSFLSNMNDSVDDNRFMCDMQNGEENVNFTNNECEVNEEDLYNYENYNVVQSITTEQTITVNNLKADYSQKDESLTEADQSEINAQNSETPSGEICSLPQAQLVDCSASQIKVGHDFNTDEMPSSAYRPCDFALKQSAPYYYSDLPISTSHIDNSQMFLNNQRTLNESKKDITHIVNPIKCNRLYRDNVDSPHADMIDDTIKIAAEARSASMDFLNLTDKTGHIDKKNIYESDTLKRLKAYNTQQGMQPASENGKNILPGENKNKFTGNDSRANANVTHSYSLENLLEDVLCSDVARENMREAHSLPKTRENVNTISEGSYLWEEDGIWRERLRSVSQRHTKSVDDLLLAGESIDKDSKKAYCGMSQDSVYVNGDVLDEPSHNILPQETENENVNNKVEMKRENSFILDREKLRQWDLLSSAPSDDQLSVITASQTPRGNSTLVEQSEGNIIPENVHLPETGSGSIIVNSRGTCSKTQSQKKMWNWENQAPQSYEPQEMPVHSQHQPNRYVPNMTQHYRPDVYAETPNKKDPSTKRMNMSAGELLGRTHEELVLLLIQLRRQSTSILHTIDNSYNEIDKIQAKLHVLDHSKKLENLQKLAQIKQHLIELEKQYEKGKPLLNLVDNMVKLGSLYRKPNDRTQTNTNITDHLEFSQQEQERRLLAEERRDWNRLHTDNIQLQQKVQQLYQLDRLIQEESGTLQSLQQDKEEIERALGGLKIRLTKGFNDPSETELAVKQQLMLENELSRVHAMLAENSKNLEETVAGNARLEQELLILRQKLQSSRHLRNSPQCSNAGDSLPCVVGSSAMLELDLQKVQQKVGDIQKQRKELSIQVRQLIDRSNNLQQQIKPSSLAQNNHCLTNKKKVTLLWRETDLDTMSVVDHGDSWDDSSRVLYSSNGEIKHNESITYDTNSKTVDLTNDEISKNLAQHEKQQEIKTVRIVKRESERRHRDRDKTIVSGRWDALVEEDGSSPIVFKAATAQKAYQTDKDTSGILNTQSCPSNSTSPMICSNQTTSTTKLTPEKSPELSPVFKSEAARQIITEMSSQETLKNNNRRAIPKEKRRHFTAPHNDIIMKDLGSLLPMDGSSFDKNCLNERRARDDLDMERALKQRLDTPDVVHSTLSKKELKYDEDTIDFILGTPNKITIPERYVPEQLPQLSVEEQEYRLRKVESIKKMLSDTAIISSSAVSGEKSDQTTSNNLGGMTAVKMIEEKKQREHLLQLNQILAQQVMEMSKIVAVGGNNEDEQ